MIAKEYINTDIPFLKTTDNLEYALSIMEDYKLNHLPVLDENHKIAGILDENTLLDVTDFETSIESVSLKARNTFVEPNQHLYEVLRFAVEYDTNIIPVSQEESNYIGAIDTTEIITTLAELNSVTNKGAILVLDIKQTDYSLSEIAKIAEDSNVQILSSGISANPSEPTRIYVTLKFNQEVIHTAVASFRRYDYTVLATFQGDSLDDDKDRLDHLFKYLDI